MKLPIALAVAATLLVACRESMCACPPAFYRIRFMGSVTGSSGPIANASVVAELTGEDCRFGEPMPNNPNQALTNAIGHYELVVMLGERGPYCARLIARWPGDSVVRDSIHAVPSPNVIVVDFDVP